MQLGVYLIGGWQPFQQLGMGSEPAVAEVLVLGVAAFRAGPVPGR